MKNTLKTFFMCSSLIVCTNALATSSDTIQLIPQPTTVPGNGHAININLYNKLNDMRVYNITCHIYNNSAKPIQMEATSIDTHSQTIDKDGYSQDYYMPQLRLILNGIHGSRDHFIVQPGDNTLVIQDIDGWAITNQAKDEAIVLRNLGPAAYDTNSAVLAPSPIKLKTCTATPMPKAKSAHR